LKYTRQDYPWKLAFVNIKWILFKARPTVDEQVQLEKAFKQSVVLKAVVDLRNTFHSHFETATNPSMLLANLQTWMSQVIALGYEGFFRFVTTLCMPGILSQSRRSN
jgi:hypothetical protein